MTRPQAGIFSEDLRYHHHLEFRVDPGVSAAALAAVLGPALAGQDDQWRQLLVAFGPALWLRLAPAAVPPDLRDFTAIDGGERMVPSTQRDLWLWIQGAAYDENIELALSLNRGLRPLADLELDLPAFTYFQSRDLTGFEDGTGNPKGDGRALAALVPAGRPGGGGSIALTQRWVHDLDGFLALPESEQEQIIGRTKAESIELEGDAMPRDSHVSRTDVKVDGIGMKVWRRSTPFGTVGENGLHFISFACELRRHQIQLERMFGVSGDGIQDRLIGFSRAVTGSYWFVPGVEDLEAALSAG